MTDNDIAKAISNATNGNFVTEHCESTCMGWVNKYDEEGRLLTADPNYKTSYIYICENQYKVIRRGWFVWIIRPEYTDKINYLSVYNAPKECFVGNDYIDLRPDYVKEYEANRLKSLKKSEVEFRKHVKIEGKDWIVTKTKEDPNMPAYILGKYITNK